MKNIQRKYIYGGLFVLLVFISFTSYKLYERAKNNTTLGLQNVQIGTAQKSQVDSQVNNPSKLNIASSSYKILLANTDELRQKGLGSRQGIDTNEVMLFVFDNEAKHFFWMKDMLFPIDMVWLDKDKKVIYIEQNVAPDTYPKAFGPQVDSQYVLEFQEGTVKREGLSLGEQITFE
ncbi:MAG: DUF192 domain-containing protein [Candidatus Pacebacteria bacterium]|nr:DUF192 domain-containing protein [Candidatus Paceibacterota bacterium]